MIHIRGMKKADIGIGQRLTEQAGWNQTEADWWRQLALEPDGCFIAEVDGIPVGTTATCRFGRVAWIALVLVEKSMRGRGIGSALVRHALTFLAEAGTETVRLDATSLGEPVYRKLGFAGDYSLARLAGRIEEGTFAGGKVRQAGRGADLDRLLAWDLHVTGTDRSKLLLHQYQEYPEGFLIAEMGQQLSYLIYRPGRQAWQVGSCVGGQQTAMVLIEEACHRLAGEPIYVDVPTCHEELTASLTGRGLVPQRTFLRMTRGKMVQEDITRLWASFGPEKG